MKEKLVTALILLLWAVGGFALGYLMLQAYSYVLRKWVTC